MIATGMIAPTDLIGNMGTGAAGMFETSMVAILVAAICALIKEYGGFSALLYWIKKVFNLMPELRIKCIPFIPPVSILLQ